MEKAARFGVSCFGVLYLRYQQTKKERTMKWHYFTVVDTYTGLDRFFFGGVRRFAVTVGLIINSNYMMVCVAAGFQ